MTNLADTPTASVEDEDPERGTLDGCEYKECTDILCTTVRHCECGTAIDNHRDDDPDAHGEGDLHRGKPE